VRAATAMSTPKRRERRCRQLSSAAVTRKCVAATIIGTAKVGRKSGGFGVALVLRYEASQAMTSRQWRAYYRIERERFRDGDLDRLAACLINIASPTLRQQPIWHADQFSAERRRGSPRVRRRQDWDRQVSRHLHRVGTAGEADHPLRHRR